jgi:hypothetical protein
MANCPRRPRRTARVPRHHQPSRTTSPVESDRPLDMKPRAGEVIRVGAEIESTGLRFLCSDIVVSTSGVGRRALLSSCVVSTSRMLARSIIRD